MTYLCADNWKRVFLEQRGERTLRVGAEPLTTLRVPKIFNHCIDPYERANVTSNTYYDWLIDHVFRRGPAQDYMGAFVQTFREYPPRQRAASFNIGEVMEKLLERGGGR